MEWNSSLSYIFELYYLQLRLDIPMGSEARGVVRHRMLHYAFVIATDVVQYVCHWVRCLPFAIHVPSAVTLLFLKPSIACAQGQANYWPKDVKIVGHVPFTAERDTRLPTFNSHPGPGFSHAHEIGPYDTTHGLPTGTVHQSGLPHPTPREREIRAMLSYGSELHKERKNFPRARARTHSAAAAAAATAARPYSAAHCVLR
ncbi:hypothetical protein L873DRAFT_1839561 [Choiromyces venosus 120613-1]|uniref:Uncharacterized protein n=1 Tax=Choiromyces venosus 120613-1 TaxID=1336337 RepID=A0A3N4K9W2_9PEZI|nr:hypothetical protein L873DRAFT_1839561 [Choiromyces venosus 120613-1]